MEKIISKNAITAIPGIGTKYAQRLDAVGIKKVNIINNKFFVLMKEIFTNFDLKNKKKNNCKM